MRINGIERVSHVKGLLTYCAAVVLDSKTGKLTIPVGINPYKLGCDAWNEKMADNSVTVKITLKYLQ